MLRTASQLQIEEKAFLACPQDRGAIRRWITAAQEKAQDAENVTVSTGTRFEAIYDATFNIALVVLNASGWRRRAVQGHHGLVLEAACAAIGAGEAMFDRLDAVHDMRNQKYDGIARTDADLVEANKLFHAFNTAAGAWLQNEHAALLK